MILIGIIYNIKYSHTIDNNIDIYDALLDIRRKSGKIDTIPLSIPDSVLKSNAIRNGETIELIGTLHSKLLYAQNSNAFTSYVSVHQIKSVPKDTPHQNKINICCQINKLLLEHQLDDKTKLKKFKVTVKRGVSTIYHFKICTWNVISEEILKLHTNNPDIKLNLTGRLESKKLTYKTSKGNIEDRLIIEIVVSNFTIAS